MTACSEDSPMDVSATFEHLFLSYIFLLYFLVEPLQKAKK